MSFRGVGLRMGMSAHFRDWVRNEGSPRGPRGSAHQVWKHAADKATAGIVTRIGMDDGSRRVARIFITGSSDGLGLMAARLLIEQGHVVVLHGRNEGRSRDALAAAAGAGGVVWGDLSTIGGAGKAAGGAGKTGARYLALTKHAAV